MIFPTLHRSKFRCYRLLASIKNLTEDFTLEEGLSLYIGSNVPGYQPSHQNYMDTQAIFDHCKGTLDCVCLYWYHGEFFRLTFGGKVSDAFQPVWGVSDKDSWRACTPSLLYNSSYQLKAATRLC